MVITRVRKSIRIILYEARLLQKSQNVIYVKAMLILHTPVTLYSIEWKTGRI